MRNKTLIPVIFVALGSLAGCGKGPEQRQTETFFTEWLKAHGETNVISDAGGVGIANNATRLKASPYGLKKDANGNFTAEMEFKIRLPSKGEIIEYVVGMGKSKDEAIKDSELNFLLTSFHVVYRSFMNPKDPHQAVRQVTVNGASREMMMGDIYLRGADAKKQMDVNELRNEIRDAICQLPLSPEPHWVKVVCGCAPGKAPMISGAVDNQDHDGLTAALKALKWPEAEQGYMMKEFIVVK